MTACAVRPAPLRGADGPLPGRRPPPSQTGVMASAGLPGNCRNRRQRHQRGHGPQGRLGEDPRPAVLPGRGRVRARGRGSATRLAGASPPLSAEVPASVGMVCHMMFSFVSENGGHMPESNQLLPGFRKRASYRKTAGLTFARPRSRSGRGPCGHEEGDGLDVPVRESARLQRSQASGRKGPEGFSLIHQQGNYGCRGPGDRPGPRQEGRGATSPAPCAVPSRRRGLYAKGARGPMRVSDSHYCV